LRFEECARKMAKASAELMVEVMAAGKMADQEQA